MLKFDDSFFADEEREGFFVSETMKRFWACQMDMVRVVDEVCKKHGLTWYMDWGTLLGAVRHKGWVPWDDDMDICLKRSDFIKLLQILPQEMPKEYQLYETVFKKNGSESWANILNGLYLDASQEWRDNHYGCPFIAGIDIIPVDVLPRNIDERETLVSLLKLIWTTKSAFEPRDKDKMSKESLEESRNSGEEGLKLISESLNYEFDRTKPLKSQLWTLFNYLTMSYTEEDGDEYVEWTTYLERPETVMPKDWFAEPTYIPFEHLMWPAPSNPDGVLTKWYGDYSIPKQNTSYHDYPIYNKQLEEYRKFVEKIHKNELT